LGTHNEKVKLSGCLSKYMYVIETTGEALLEQTDN